MLFGIVLNYKSRHIFGSIFKNTFHCSWVEISLIFITRKGNLTAAIPIRKPFVNILGLIPHKSTQIC